MDVVLFSPDIPQNVGNIGRTCAATQTKLILVRPLGFSIHDKHLKRAGLDYWPYLDWEIIDSLDTILHKRHLIFFSSHAQQDYTALSYPTDAVLVFGSETRGLPPFIREDYSSACVRIPMAPNIRCLNLASSVAIGLYEALRQQQFTTPFHEVPS